MARSRDMNATLVADLENSSSVMSIFLALIGQSDSNK